MEKKKKISILWGVTPPIQTSPQALPLERLSRAPATFVPNVYDHFKKKENFDFCSVDLFVFFDLPQTHKSILFFLYDPPFSRGNNNK
jgi:hypothetical protein